MDIFPAATPLPVLVGGFAVPYAIAYLVHIPHTRAIRLGLFPLGLLCAFWTITTIDLSPPVLTLPLSETLLKWNLNAGSQLAFWDIPPSYPALPSPPPLGSLRHTIPVKALNLLIDANRLTSLQPIARPHVPYWRAATSHLGWAILYHALNEIITFPLYSGLVVPHDPNWAMMGLGMYTGTAMVMESFVCFTVLVGLYNGEEWGGFFDWPMVSSSLNELWGRRYHHFMRGLYLRLARPFEKGPRALHIMVVFFLSALYHIILYYPFTNSFLFRPHMVFWLGSGIGCLAERAFYKATGRKVGGWWGRLWLIGWFWMVSRPIVLLEVEHGWMRDSAALSKEAKGEDHTLNWVLYALKLSGPLDWKKS